MSSLAPRLMDRDPLQAALLPRTALALELGARLRVIALLLLAPEQTLAALGAESLQSAVLFPRAVPKRRAEFAAGRHAARLALAQAGCFEAVPRAASGSPLWPAGFTGSISHGAGLAVAVVARRDHYAGIGIDVESSISDEQCAQIASRILSAEEFALLARALPTRPAAELLSLGFSAKESLYKCLNPLAAQFIEFEDARVARVLPDSATGGRIWLTLNKPFNAEFQAGFELPGRYAFAAGRIETAVWLAARSNS